MQIRTRPSLLFWMVAVLIYGFYLVVVMGGHLAVLQWIDDCCTYGVAWSVTIGAGIALVPAFLCVRWAARRCIWQVDFGGLSSPACGRIEFSDVISLHVGYPEAIATGTQMIRKLVAKLERFGDLDAEVRILKLSDGRLLPLDIGSPVVSGHAPAIAKITELLGGKLRPNSEFAPEEIDALRTRPANRFVAPKRRI